MRIDRRFFAAGAMALPLAPLSASAQGPLAGESYDAADLAVPGPLGDKPLGNDFAPVLIYEYASLTCGHCATFHANGFKFLKERYIDTGKVKYIRREFPLDPLAAAGFMLAHCAGEGKYHPMVDLLFTRQQAWTRTDKPVDALLGIVRQAGFTQESFESCLKNQAIYDGVNAVRSRGMERFRIDSTPTFFINGRKYKGALSPQELERIIEPLLKA